jgi:hypothetical protein
MRLAQAVSYHLHNLPIHASSVRSATFSSLYSFLSVIFEDLSIGHYFYFIRNLKTFPLFNIVLAAGKYYLILLKYSHIYFAGVTKTRGMDSGVARQFLRALVLSNGGRGRKNKD